MINLIDRASKFALNLFLLRDVSAGVSILPTGFSTLHVTQSVSLICLAGGTHASLVWAHTGGLLVALTFHVVILRPHLAFSSQVKEPEKVDKGEW